MSIMYNLTRVETAEQLNISTRSVDRYIKSWKLRSQKRGKIVYVNETDVNNMLSGWNKKQEVIIETKKTNKTKEVTVKNTENNKLLSNIYSDLKNQIQVKDKQIHELSVRLWQAEEIAKNSISLIDYKKSQFLLEESKWYLNKKVDELEKDKEKLKEDLSSEKKSNFILIIFVVILLAIAWTIWFIKI